MEKKTLWIMCGAPASGKSYFAKKLINGPGWRYISRDTIRFEIVSEEEDYFKHEKEVYKKFIYSIYSALNQEGIFNIIADATHLNWASRNKLITNLKKIYRDFDGLNIIPVVMETDVETMIKRNETRAGREKVPQSAIKNMYSNFTDPKNDSYNYTSIMYVGGNQKILIEKPKVMYKKNDVKMKEYSVKDIIERG
jgi:predicted kinase